MIIYLNNLRRKLKMTKPIFDKLIELESEFQLIRVMQAVLLLTLTYPKNFSDPRGSLSCGE